MGNMSYCRFENTANDLQDCVYALNDNEVEDLSSYEVRGLRDLLYYAKDIVEMEGYIEEIITKNKHKDEY
jgi:hypothetical protein